MTTYTLSYFVKGAKVFEEGATVVDMGNGWFRVVKTFKAEDQKAAMDYAMSLRYPRESAGHILEYGYSLSEYTHPKAKRKAAWKQNPLARFATRGTP